MQRASVACGEIYLAFEMGCADDMTLLLLCMPGLPVWRDDIASRFQIRRRMEKKEEVQEMRCIRWSLFWAAFRDGCVFFNFCIEIQCEKLHENRNLRGRFLGTRAFDHRPVLAVNWFCVGKMRKQRLNFSSPKTFFTFLLYIIFFFSLSTVFCFYLCLYPFVLIAYVHCILFPVLWQFL